MRIMKPLNIGLAISLIAAGALTATADTKDPRLDVPGPTYMNAEVIRVDADAGTITLKSESSEAMLRVEGEARAELSCLRPKDKVIVTYHVVDDGAGGSRRVAIQVRPSLSSGEPARPPARKAVTLGVQDNPEQVVRITRDMVAATPAHLQTISESAAQDFESNVARLAPQANAIDGLWRGFQEVCLPEPPATNRSRGWFQLLEGTIPEPDQDGCRQQYKEMISRGERVQEFIKLAEEAARKAEVAPGRLRATLERHRLDF
jgi:hypothetical protein